MIIGEFCDVFPPQIDGVGMVASNYVKQLNKKNNECYYIAPKTKKCDTDAILEDTLNVINHISLPMPHEAYRMGLPGIDLSYLKEVKAIDFDIVHAHTPFSTGLEALRIARQREIPLVATFHSKYYDDFYSKTHSKFWAKRGTGYVVSFFNKCDEVWTVNEPTAEVLKNYGYDGEIFIMPNGTDLWYPTENDKLEAQEKYSLSDGDVLLFVGQHNFKKNIKHIIEAIEIYASRHSNFKMVFVGQGPDAEKMHEMIHEKGLDERTVFTGHISDRNELMKLYARADLFIFPSIYDNASLAMREAAAAGTPTLMIRNSCIAKNIIDGENGFLCDDTPESIAEGIERALPDAPRVGVNARNTIPTPWSDIVDMALQRYEMLIDKKKFERKKETI